MTAIDALWLLAVLVAAAAVVVIAGMIVPPVELTAEDRLDWLENQRRGAR